MKNLTPELIAQAKSVKSAEQLLELAKAHHFEMTEAEAKTCFAQLNANGSVDDDELELVAGGACDGDSEQKTEVTYKRGDIVAVIDGSKCDVCGTNIGVIAFRINATESHIAVDAKSGYCVKCQTCNRPILERFSESKVRKI